MESMSIYKIVLLSVLFLHNFDSSKGQLLGHLHYERPSLFGGLLPSRTVDAKLQIPTLSSGLHAVAGGVHNILNSAKETVHKLTRPISVEFNAEVQNPHHFENGNGQNNHKPEKYPHYEMSTDSHISNNNDSPVDSYIENNFPVILLQENEIRR